MDRFTLLIVLFAYINYLSLVLLLVFAIAYSDHKSFYLSKKRSKHLDEPYLDSVPENFALIKIACVILLRISFSMTFNKIETGYIFPKPKFSLKKLLASSFYWFLGLTSLFMKILGEVLKMREAGTAAAYLLKYTRLSGRRRKINFCDGSWALNPKGNPIVIAWFCKHFPYVPKAEADHFSFILERHLFSLKTDLGNSEVVWAKSLNNKGGYHAHVMNETKNKDEFIALTDLRKAEKFDNYGEKAVLNRVDILKPTAGLSCHKSTLDDRAAMLGTVDKGRLITGACLYGCDESSLSGAFLAEKGLFDVETMACFPPDAPMEMKLAAMGDIGDLQSQLFPDKSALLSKGDESWLD